MTTVFGIKFPNVDATVLVADRQTTSLDVTTKIPYEKMLRRKLWTSQDGNFCFGHAGNRDERTMDLIQSLVEGDHNVQEIIKKGYFPQLRSLNLKKMGRQIPNPMDLSGIIVASRFDGHPKLHTCFPLGDVEERMWVSAGSGEEKIMEYIKAMQVFSEAQDYKEARTPTVSDAITLGLEAVRRSQSQDLYSYGLDMLVCLPEGIKDHHAELGDDFGRKLVSLREQYTPEAKTPKSGRPRSKTRK